MIFDNVYSINEILTAISIVIVIIGGFFSLFQWRKNQLLQRSECINNLTEKIRTDDDIKEVVYLFDYDNPWYTETFHDSGEMELRVDKTLSYFSYICYLRENRLLTSKEFKFFEYEIRSILLNSQVLYYLYNLYHFAKKHRTNLTFYYLFLYGKKNKYYDPDYGKYKSFFDNDFFDPESDNYPHYLNF